MNVYTTRTEAIQAEIIDPIEASGVASAAEFDIEMIADLVLEYDSINGREGFIVKREIDHDEFWQIVERHAL